MATAEGSETVVVEPQIVDEEDGVFLGATNFSKHNFPPQGLHVWLAPNIRQGVAVGAAADDLPAVAISADSRHGVGPCRSTRAEIRVVPGQDVIVTIRAGKRVTCTLSYSNGVLSFRRRRPDQSVNECLATTLNWVFENQKPLTLFRLAFPDPEGKPTGAPPIPGAENRFSVLYSTTTEPITFFDPALSHPLWGIRPAWRERRVSMQVGWVTRAGTADRLVMRELALVSSWAEESFEIVFLTSHAAETVCLRAGGAYKFGLVSAGTASIYGITGQWVQAGSVVAPFRLSFGD